MGIERLGGPSEPFDAARAARWVLDVVKSAEDANRREEMRQSVCLYRDDFESVLHTVIGQVFEVQAVVERLWKLERFAGYSSFLKRVSDEVARPLYASAPTRIVYKEGERVPRGMDPSLKPTRATFRKLAKTAGWDEAMDTAARLLVACAPVFIIGRYIEGVGPVLDVATGDTVSIIPDPQRPTKALAVIYQKTAVTPFGTAVTSYAVADDKRTFEVNSEGKSTPPVPHTLGRIPVVEIHARGRWGSYWSTRGRDLRAASLALMVLDAITLKKHKSQSHIQLAASGDVQGLPKNQVLDEESVLIFDGSNATIQPIDLQADPSGLHSTAAKIVATTAANYGLSMDRINQKSTMEQNAALNERTAELAGVMVEAEKDAFDLICRLSSANPDSAMRLDAETLRLAVDYRAQSMRLDPKTERELWEIDRKAGRRDPIDDIIAQNPEIGDDEEAKAFMRWKIANTAEVIEWLRALNAPVDGTVTGQPGQGAEQNGAMGPKVRDGQMTKDEAAQKAKGPPAEQPGVSPEEN